MKLAWFAILASVLVLSAPAAADTVASFTLPSGVEVRLVEDQFDRSHSAVDGCREDGGKCLIDGHVPFGCIGLPKTFVKEVSVSFQGASYKLDVSDMYNAWGSRPLEHRGVIRYFGGKCDNRSNCVFRGLFSDAAAAFVAEWAIVNGVSFRTVLTNSDDVMELFSRHIDPPEYK